MSRSPLEFPNRPSPPLPRARLGGLSPHLFQSNPPRACKPRPLPIGCVLSAPVSGTALPLRKQLAARPSATARLRLLAPRPSVIRLKMSGVLKRKPAPFVTRHRSKPPTSLPSCQVVVPASPPAHPKSFLPPVTRRTLVAASALPSGWSRSAAASCISRS